MKIPEGFAVPDFVLEHVRVAPESWESPTDPTSAKALLGEMRVCLQSPVILAVMCDLVRVLSTADSDIDNHRFNGVQDVFNQQQLIGEKRGLRRFFIKLQEIHDHLTEKSNLV